METKPARILWTIVLVVLGAVVVLAAVFGPGLYRKGRSVVGPIVELTKIEEEAKLLEQEFPFAASEDAELDPQRFETFLHMREQLLPRYESWAEAELRVQQQGESWETAADILEVTREVMQAQNDLLRQSSMPPSEFRWLERRVYDTWLRAVENGGSGDPMIVRERLAECTREDLEAVERITAEHGSSRGLRAVRQRLEERLNLLEVSGPPIVEGISEAEGTLLWGHRERIVGLRFDEHQDVHSRLRTDHGNVQVNLGEEQ